MRSLGMPARSRHSLGAGASRAAPTPPPSGLVASATWWGEGTWHNMHMRMHMYMCMCMCMRDGGLAPGQRLDAGMGEATGAGGGQDGWGGKAVRQCGKGEWCRTILTIIAIEDGSSRNVCQRWGWVNGWWWRVGEGEYREGTPRGLRGRVGEPAALILP